MFNYLVTVAYDGSGFAGWAKQNNRFTVQNFIEDVLSKVFNQKINILAVSRTDKGVHACSQNFTIRLNFFLSTEKMFFLLGKVLKKYVQVKKIKEVGLDFHPLSRNVVNFKEYRYFINTKQPDIFCKRYCWDYNSLLDVNKLKNILNIFLGIHDFFNFCYCPIINKNIINTVREISSIRVNKTIKRIIIVIRARSFLRYQIRAIIGESINCYEGGQNIETLRNKLINSDYPNKYRYIAPASGLYLWKVNFNKKFLSKNFNIKKLLKEEILE